MFYRATPRGVYIKKSAKNDIRGSKAMMDKTRYFHACSKTSVVRGTLNLCCNFTGTHKITPLLIGHAARPACWRRQEPPKGIFYRHNKTAWANGDEMQWWFDNVFVPEVRAATPDEPILLIWDNFSGTCFSLTLLQL